MLTFMGSFHSELQIVLQHTNASGAILFVVLAGWELCFSTPHFSKKRVFRRFTFRTSL